MTEPPGMQGSGGEAATSPRPRLGQVAAGGGAPRLPPRWRARAALVLALVALGVAVRCAVAGVEDAALLLARINIREPALAALPAERAGASAARPTAAATAPPRPTPLRRALSRRVVLVVIDGLGDASSHGLPVLDELRRRGVSATAQSHLPSLSRPNYVSILTGVPPRESGVRSNSYAWEVPLDSLLHRVRGSGRQTAFVTDVAPGFGAMFAGELSDATATPWRGGLLRAGLLALKRRYPLVVLIPGAVDDAGHARGAASAAYRRAAGEVDAQLGQLAAELDLTRDTLVVTADHGHTAAGGHGGDEPEVLTVPLVLVGAGIRAGAAPTGARLIDLAPTVAALLGAPPPRHALGRALVEVLALPGPAAAALAEEDRQRRAHIAAFLRTAPRGPQDEAARPLLDRAFASLALAALLLFLFTAVRRAHLAHLDRRGLAVALATPLFAAAALLAAGGGELSLSSLANRAEGTRALLAAAAVSVATFLGGTRWALARRAAPERLGAATGLALAALALAGWASHAVAAALGAPPWQELPPASLLLLAPLASLSQATAALGAALLLALELLLRVAAPETPRPAATKGWSSSSEPAR